jgi:hypothetical protein
MPGLVGRGWWRLYNIFSNFLMFLYASVLLVRAWNEFLQTGFQAGITYIGQGQFHRSLSIISFILGVFIFIALFIQSRLEKVSNLILGLSSLIGIILYGIILKGFSVSYTNDVIDLAGHRIYTEGIVYYRSVSFITLFILALMNLLFVIMNLLKKNKANVCSSKTSQ